METQTRCIVLYKENRESWAYPYNDICALLQFWSDREKLWLTESTFHIKENMIHTNIFAMISKYMQGKDFYIKQIDANNTEAIEKLQQEVDVNIEYIIQGK